MPPGERHVLCSYKQATRQPSLPLALWRGRTLLVIISSLRRTCDLPLPSLPLPSRHLEQPWVLQVPLRDFHANTRTVKFTEFWVLCVFFFFFVIFSCSLETAVISVHGACYSLFFWHYIPQKPGLGTFYICS